MSRSHCGLLVILLGAACGDDVPPASDTEGTQGTSTTASTEGGSGSVSDSTVDGDSSGDGSGGSVGEALGCSDTPLLQNPEDPAAPGPWPVGVTTVQLEGRTAEVWYPAQPGSEAGVETVRYDVRESLPEAEGAKISDEDNPWQPCDCARDLPVDDAHGPYPVVFFIHGTAGFRTQSLPQMTHWASRGFVVIALDHPGLWLRDLLGSICGGPSVTQALGDDVQVAMQAVRGQVPGLEAFADIVDAERFAVAGHSAGGRAAGAFADDAQVLIPMAAGGVEPGSALQSTLVLGALADSVVPYDSQTDGYDDSPAPKRLVGIDNQGHLAFSSLCSLRNAAGDDLLTIANANMVCGATVAGALFQCDAAFLPDPDAWQIVNFATSAVLEQTLHCSAIGDAFDQLQTSYPAVAEFRSEP